MQSKVSPLSLDPTQLLISFALRDDPLVHKCWENAIRVRREISRLRGKAYISALQRSGKHHERLSKQICKKYRIPGWFGIDFFHATKEEWLASIKAMSRHAPFTWGTNWGHYYSTKTALTYIPQRGSRWKRTDKEGLNAPAKPKNEIPFLAIRLDLSQVNGRDIERLTRDFKSVLKDCLKNLPGDLKKPSSTWARNIERDYRRFRQHIEQAVPLRWIAHHERGNPMPKRSLGFIVAAESSVRESVDRVHRILFQQPYRARIHGHRLVESRLDQTVKMFNCPDHGRECSDSCSYAKAFIEEYL